MGATSQIPAPSPFKEVGTRAQFGQTQGPKGNTEEIEELVDADEKSFQDVFIKRKKK